MRRGENICLLERLLKCEMRMKEFIKRDFDEAHGSSHAIKEFVSAIEQKDCSNNMMIATEVQSILEERKIVKGIVEHGK